LYALFELLEQFECYIQIPNKSSSIKNQTINIMKIITVNKITRIDLDFLLNKPKNDKEYNFDITICG
jgi:hypothetical protein